MTKRNLTRTATILVSLVAPARADTSTVLREISNTAERLCGDVSQSGSATTSQVTGDVKAELNGLAKKLANLGIAGTGSITSNEYQGVLREQLTAALKDARDCRISIFDKLEKKLLPNTTQPETRPPRNPNALYQYGEAVAEVQGAIISQANGTVTFQVVKTAGKADPTREVEYQDWVLNCPNLPRPSPNELVGLFSGMVIAEQCTIIRKLP